jgi:hypothetical protein
MKHLGFFLLFVTGLVQAQNIKVVNIEQLTRLKDGEFVVSAVSPAGDKVIASSPGYKGLFIIDINLKKILRITGNAGAGYEPSLSADGLKVFFRSDEFAGVKKYSSLSEYDLTTGKTVIIESKSRDVTPPLIINNLLIYSADGKRNERMIKSGAPKSTRDRIYVILENLTPVLYINGIRKPISPNGEGNYIWVSLSPDKTKLLYNYKGSGTFVSKLDGTILDDLGRLNAPRWLNDQLIVGMNDKDDGYKILSSDIICYSLATKKKVSLTATSDKIEMYPIPFAGGNRIVYQTLTGELYILNLSVK